MVFAAKNAEQIAEKFAASRRKLLKNHLFSNFSCLKKTLIMNSVYYHQKLVQMEDSGKSNTSAACIDLSLCTICLHNILEYTIKSIYHLALPLRW